MKSKEIPMTIEEYHLIEHPFGWKAEYCYGKAEITPREHILTAKLNITERVIKQTFDVIPITPSYKPQMIEAFFEAFKDSVEFCNWETEQIYKHAENNINNYFDGKRGKPIPDSVMVLEPNDKIAGLALFLFDDENETHLDLLFVKPLYQGKKMATEMVSNVVNHLYKEGVKELFSAYHICNEASSNWHHSFGFNDLYDQLYIRLKYSWLRHEIWRHEKLGLVDKVEELAKERDRWFSQLEDRWRY